MLYVKHRHEIAEAAGLISQAFGTEEVDRHIVLFKKVIVSTADNDKFHELCCDFTCRSMHQQKLNCKHSEEGRSVI